jgi:hypothetical protein
VQGETCRRQGAWYRQSDKNGKYLVISDKPLPEYEPETVIEVSDFKAPGLPDTAGIKKLAEDKEYKKSAPEEWFKLTRKDNNHWKKLLAKLKIDESLEQGFEIHNANHANFIKGEYSVKTDKGPAPYSIADSAHVCSSCVELFNLHSAMEKYKVKYVMPCPGLVIYVGFEKDRYLKVASERQVH